MRQPISIRGHLGRWVSAPALWRTASWMRFFPLLSRFLSSSRVAAKGQMRPSDGITPSLTSAILDQIAARTVRITLCCFPREIKTGCWRIRPGWFMGERWIPLNKVDKIKYSELLCYFFSIKGREEGGEQWADEKIVTQWPNCRILKAPLCHWFKNFKVSDPGTNETRSSCQRRQTERSKVSLCTWKQKLQLQLLLRSCESNDPIQPFSSLNWDK